jgi:hypothetical protein
MQTAQSAPANLHWNGLRVLPGAALPRSAMWRSTMLVEQPDGREESFSIGPDGYVWSFEGGPGHAASRLTSTGLQARTFAVGRSGEGALVVVAAGDSGVHSVHETGSSGTASQRWSAPRPVTLPRLAGDGVIEQIVTQTREGNLFVGFVICQHDASGTTRLRMLDAVWAAGTLVIRHEPIRSRSGLRFWIDSLHARRTH